MCATCCYIIPVMSGLRDSPLLMRHPMQGFRRYQKIRETLVHELTHMVWGDHDNNFKQLNSQLLREAAQLDWTAQPGGECDTSALAYVVAPPT